MIDCGVPFKKIKDELYEIKYLLITHIHSDHLNNKTIASIKKLFPHIVIIGNYEVHQVIETHYVSNAGYPVKTTDYTFIPFECDHNVVTQGYTWCVDGQNIIYATDTSHLDNAPIDTKYDYLFIESNYDENKIRPLLTDTSKTYNPAFDSLRHLSKQKAKAFYYMHRRSKDSIFVELHQSKRFY